MLSSEHRILWVSRSAFSNVVTCGGRVRNDSCVCRACLARSLISLPWPLAFCPLCLLSASRALRIRRPFRDTTSCFSIAGFQPSLGIVPEPACSRRDSCRNRRHVAAVVSVIQWLLCLLETRKRGGHWKGALVTVRFPGGFGQAPTPSPSASNHSFPSLHPSPALHRRPPSPSERRALKRDETGPIACFRYLGDRHV